MTRKELLVFTLLAAILFVAGCALTDEQINQIATATQTGVESVVKPIVQVAAPTLDPTGTGAAAGIASVVGLAVAYGVRQLLLLIRKKPVE